MTSDKKTLLEGVDASSKSKLMSVGGHADTPVDLVVAGNADAKHPCLGNGQTVIMRTPTQIEFHNFSHGPNNGVYGQGNCSWKSGYYFATSRYIHEQNYSGDRQEAG